jgi:hypothetical protein
MSEEKKEECSPCKAAAYVGIGVGICRKTKPTEEAECDKILAEYKAGKLTLSSALEALKKLAVEASSNEAIPAVFNKLIADLKEGK